MPSRPSPPTPDLYALQLNFPGAVLAADAELNPLSASRRAFSIFGIRARADRIQSALSGLS